MTSIVYQQHDAIADFVEEALESLRALPAHLDVYRSARAVAEPINAVFRAVHSIKGCAAFLGLDTIRDFSHRLESTLDVMRSESTPLSDSLERDILSAFDRLDALLQQVAVGNNPLELQPEDERILESVRASARGSCADALLEEDLHAALQRLAERMDAGGPVTGKFSHELRRLLQDHSHQPRSQSADTPLDAQRLPDDYRDSHFTCSDTDVTVCVGELLQFFFDFADGRNSPQRERLLLESLQAFASWADSHAQSELAQALKDAAGEFRTIHESPLDLDDMLVSLIWDRLAPHLERLRTDKPHDRAANSARDGEVPTDRADTTAPTACGSTAKSRFVRVRQEHLDEFLDQVSRMFITSERYRDVHGRMAKTHEIPELVDELRQINMDLKVQSTAIQHGVMALRRVAIAGLFSKFPRMARTLASQLGKQLQAHLSGEETEIDKQLSDDLDAALTHLVRNVVDHAIEAPEERIAGGKASVGNLYLEGQSTGNQIIILVRDDGRGIDPQRLRAKALEKGILTQAQTDSLSHKDTLQLIFEAGLSTAAQVSDVSGRGVGMDVVRSTVERHHGQIFVESAIGQGTTIRLEFPIRQATLVVDGLMVACGCEPFIIPFDHVKEIVRLDAARTRTVHGRNVVTLRDGTYDMIHLAALTGAACRNHSSAVSDMAVVVKNQFGGVCIGVDDVVGHRQVVVTPLHDVLPHSTQLLGVAQLGSGRLAPVLNIPELVDSRLNGARLSVTDKNTPTTSAKANR